MQPKSIYTKLAHETIEKYLLNNQKPNKNEYLNKELEKRAGCFVTLHNKEDDSLRGCIGTIIPYYSSLFEEIVENAIASATRDPRFSPVEYNELNNLYISVDILTEPILIESIDELDPKKYGVIVSDGYRKGVLLPDLDGVDSVIYQLDIAKQKAGIYKNGYDGLDIYKFESKRYY
ncbi:MAG: hypothetical protein PWP46_1328 [Fusobacteriaceae bacterium]|jgi:AmmeMemoRadiSam system protein A|nr:hypothetical protein [Fusobacteriaceae bacterium]